MIISKTPFRISFFGGGTDYPAWYSENGGKVLSTTIDKYCYISCRYLPPFFKHKHRIVYSLIENVKETSEIKHPSVREVLQYMNIHKGIEIHHDGDLPAKTGLGTSSSFTVGLLHSLYALKGMMPTKMKLAREAIHIEQNIIKETVGSQDQVAASFGGFNLIEFKKDGEISVNPVILRSDKLQELQNHLMLYFTGISRFASEIARKKVENFEKRQKELSGIYQMVDSAVEILSSDTTSIKEFGNLLGQCWRLKKTLTDEITSPQIDEIYDMAMRAGAIGGKLLGAGGGGFFLLFAEPHVQPGIREKLKHLLEVPFKFETSGSQIIVYQP